MKKKPKTLNIKPRKNYGISRIDQESNKTYGWYVRVYGRRKFFADKLHGSKRKSREQAENYRDILAMRMPEGLQIKAAKPRRKEQPA